MSAIDGTETVGEQKVEDDTGPEAIGHAERCCAGGREPLEPEKGIGRQHERPDFLQIGIGEWKESSIGPISGAASEAGA